MKTKVKVISDRYSEEEVLEMIKKDDFTEDGIWKAVYVEKIRGFYNILLVLTNKGRYYECLEDYKDDGFFKIIEFESEDLPFEELEKKAIELCPKGFSYIYVDLKHYLRRENDKQIRLYKALYEIK